MRLLKMFLMLCLLQLPAAGALKCHKSLIKGVTDAEIQYDSVNKTLTCTGKPNSLVAIHFKSRIFEGIDATPYLSLTCDETSGWRAQNKILFNEDNQIRASSSELYIKCVEYCSSNGAPATKYDANSVAYITITDRGNCRIYYAWRQLIDTNIFCTPYTFLGDKNGWMDNNYHRISSEMTVPQQFETKCNKEAPPPCIVELIELMDDGSEERSERQYQDLDVNLLTRTLTCRNTNERSLTAIKYQYRAKKFRSGSLECDKVGGWKSKIMTTMSGESIILNSKVADATFPLKVECVEFCAAPNGGIIYNKNGETVEIKCPDYFELRSLNSVPLTRATCDVSGKWTLKSENNETKIDSPDFECTPTRCYMPNTDGVHFDKATKTLTCDAVDNSLIAIEINSDLFSSVRCDNADGWSGLVDGSRRKTIAEARSQLDFKCVKYCTPSEVNNAVQSKDSDSTKFSCNGNTANGNVYEIRLNGNFVKPPLKCNIAQGYTDATNAKLAASLDNVKVDCASRSTTTTTTTAPTTPTPTSSKKPVVSVTTPGSKAEEPQAQSSVTVVCASIGGVLLLIIVVVVIFIVLKKRRPENSENRKKSGGSKEKHRKGNDKSGAEQNSSGQ